MFDLNGIGKHLEPVDGVKRAMLHNQRIPQIPYPQLNATQHNEKFPLRSIPNLDFYRRSFHESHTLEDLNHVRTKKTKSRSTR